MSNDVVKFAFIAGEISPTLYGRTDLTKYDLAVAEGLNFFVDYRGGLSSRPGTAVCDWVKSDTDPTKAFSFSFSPGLSNNYLVFFGHNYIRFLQDGAYVLEAPLTITGITQAATAVVTSAGHGLANGRWIKISSVVGMTQVNSRTYEVRNVAANTFELYSVPDGVAVNSTAFTAYTSGGQATPIYEVVSPYAGTDLEGLTVSQYRDLLRLTHADFPVKNLTRNDHTDWVLSDEVFSPYSDGPDITSFSTSTAGAAETVFAVTKILEDGQETPSGAKALAYLIVNYPATEGSVSINWTAESDAVEYFVYRSIVSVTETLTQGAELGYVGRTSGTKFTDPNIIPDFSRAPPISYDPFAPGAIERIVVTGGGAGYPTFGSTITITDPDGTGFVGEVIIDDAGDVVNVVIKSGGTGYTAPVVSFGGGGAGATATATVRELVGTYPALSAIYQQRQVYAASANQPITIWGSQIKRFSNFSSSPLVLDSDSYEFDLDTAAIAPIRHLLITRGGLLAMTQENVWLVNGGSSSESITPTNALAEPQTYTGVSALPPIQLENEILYTEGKGFTVRMLSYNEISKVYGGEDKSILSNHLFGFGKELISWAHQESPFKVVWCVRQDGALLAFTTVKSEEVFAWTPCQTKGRFLDVVTVREGNSDRIYLTTQRFISGRWTKFIERMDLRQFTNVEDAWCVDCGLSLGSTTPPSSLTIFQTDGVWTATAFSVFVFIASVGKILRASNGIFRVSSILSADTVELEMYEMPTNLVPESGDSMTFPIEEGDWTLDTPTATLSGLWHLEGETVSILGDGNVFPAQEVVNGSITLSHPVSRAIVGLPYTCRAKTLPVIVPDAGIESKRKRVVGLAVRLDKSRGLKYGRTLDHLYDMRERTNEAMGRPTRLVNGIHYQFISTNWDEDGQTYFVQENPLPITLLSLVTDIEVGDEPD